MFRGPADPCNELGGCGHLCGLLQFLPSELCAFVLLEQVGASELRESRGSRPSTQELGWEGRGGGEALNSGAFDVCFRFHMQVVEVVSRRVLVSRFSLIAVAAGLVAAPSGKPLSGHWMRVPGVPAKS